MNDDELRRLLQNSLSGRRASPGVHERILRALRPRWMLRVSAAAAAALLLVAAGGLLLFRTTKAPLMPALIARAVEHHVEAGIYGNPTAGQTSREMKATVSEAAGREIDVPTLRDLGFVQHQAHHCRAMNSPHVVYSNSWLKVSCFILETGRLDLSKGRRLTAAGMEVYSFQEVPYSVVAVGEGGIVKLWVADLRSEQLAAIAVDAEEKRNQLKTTVFSIADKAGPGPVEAILQSMPGVEDVQMEPEKKEAHVKYDRRRVSVEDIAAMMVLHEFGASPREWGGGGR